MTQTNNEREALLNKFREIILDSLPELPTAPTLKEKG